VTDRKHLTELGLLALIYALGAYLFMAAPDFSTKRLTALLMAAIYPTWGVIHHLEHHDLSRSTAAEYILVGLVTFLVLYSLVG
jgi:hypothetical protein